MSVGDGPDAPACGMEVVRGGIPEEMDVGIVDCPEQRQEYCSSIRNAVKGDKVVDTIETKSCSTIVNAGKIKWLFG